MTEGDAGGEKSPGMNPDKKLIQDPEGAGMVPSQPGGLNLPNVARQVFLGILLLLSLIATLQFYFTVQDLIRTWVNDPYVPVVNAVFYIGVIAGSILVIHRWLVTR